MNKLDLAYLAGIMDSDGSFTIVKDSSRERREGKTPAYGEMLSISQCEPEAIQLMASLFGGHIHAERVPHSTRRTLYHWQATHTKAIAIVHALLPYLRIKRAQGEVLLALRAIKERGKKANTHKTGTYANRLRPEVVAEMEALRLEIIRLKRCHAFDESITSCSASSKPLQNRKNRTAHEGSE